MESKYAKVMVSRLGLAPCVRVRANANTSTGTMVITGDAAQGKYTALGRFCSMVSKAARTGSHRNSEDMNLLRMKFAGRSTQ